MKARAIDPALRATLATMDLARVRRALAHLEGWWSELAKGLDTDLTRGDLTALTRRADALRDSRFFHVVCDEGALARFALECRVVAEVLPEAAEEARVLRAAVEALEARVQEALGALRRTRADLRWAALLKSPGA